MLSLNLTWGFARIELNREEICQNCEVWICIENCRKCLFNALCTYEPSNNHDHVDC